MKHTIQVLTRLLKAEQALLKKTKDKDPEWEKEIKAIRVVIDLVQEQTYREDVLQDINKLKNIALNQELNETQKARKLQ